MLLMDNEAFVISSFLCGVYEVFALLECYAEKTGSFFADVSGQHIGQIFRS
jgi:hypothetical protein